MADFGRLKQPFFLFFFGDLNGGHSTAFGDGSFKKKNSSCASKIRMRYHSATVFGLPGCSVVRLYVVKIFTMFVSSLGRAMITYKWLNAQSRWDPVKTAPASSATITRRWKTGGKQQLRLYLILFSFRLFFFSRVEPVLLFASRPFFFFTDEVETKKDMSADIGNCPWWPGFFFSNLRDVSLANAKRYTNTAEKKRGGNRVTGRRRKNKNNNLRKRVSHIFMAPPFYFIPFFFFFWAVS